MKDRQQDIADIFEAESTTVLATLIRLLGDFDLAEVALQEAFLAATTDWPKNGIPERPSAWLVSAGRFRALDLVRREDRFRQLQPELQQRLTQIDEHNHRAASHDIQDDRLRLIFTCCHPAIDPKVQVPLTLREVCGMSTEEIADAFLTSPTTMAQRIVRGKSKIRDARIPYVVPSVADLPERIDAVLSVVYLVFNEGYSASAGDRMIRTELSGEAIRLGRLLKELLPDPEVLGLLALMLLHESRREARVDSDGDIVLLDDQDRSKWNQALIEEGRQLVQQVLHTRRIGFYGVQAVISSVHANAADAGDTDWKQIVHLYDVLTQIAPSPVVELNRAVAVAMNEGPEAGLSLIDQILQRGDLLQYHLAHASRAELLRRCDRTDEAIEAFRAALSLARQDSERRFLQKRLKSLGF